jgi:hypothetical protein
LLWKKYPRKDIAKLLNDGLTSGTSQIWN